MYNKIPHKLFYTKGKKSMNLEDKFYDSMNDDCAENDEMKLVWGIKSADDFTTSLCNLLTMNDFDLIYLKDRKKYIIEIETIYQFDGGLEARKKYLTDILNEFTKWMVQNNYSIYTQVEFRQMFTKGLNMNEEFDSIEDAYATFKCLVNGYCNQ